MGEEWKCLKCKWHMNDEVIKKLYPNGVEEYFKYTNCGCGSDYYCAISKYSLFEEKK